MSKALSLQIVHLGTLKVLKLLMFINLSFVTEPQDTLLYAGRLRLTFGSEGSPNFALL